MSTHTHRPLLPNLMGALASLDPSEPPTPAVHVATLPCPDDGPRYAAALGAYRGAERHTRAAAEADAAALRAEVERLSAPGDRAHALLASAPDLDAVLGHHASPTSAALRVLRWVVKGPLYRAPTGGEDCACEGLDRVTLGCVAGAE